MPVVIGKETEVVITLDGSEDEEIHAFFPARGSDELAKALRSLRAPMLSSRTPRAASKRLHGARIAFFDTYCRRVENVDYINEKDEQVPLTPDVDGWQGMIDDDIKLSFVQYFEGRTVLSKSDVGN